MLDVDEPTPEAVITRALTRVERQGDCIVSLYSAANSGYAQIGWQDKKTKKTRMRLVHRIAWEAEHGYIPKLPQTVDHICHNKKCLNIDHLRLLSNVDNGRRNGIGRDFPVGWLCKNNHPASSQMQVKRGKRIGSTCRECQNLANAKYAANNKDKKRQSNLRWVEKAAQTLTPDDPRHGRPATYSRLKCRCDLCRIAIREYQRESKRRREAK